MQHPMSARRTRPATTLALLLALLALVAAGCGGGGDGDTGGDGDGAKQEQDGGDDAGGGAAADGAAVFAANCQSCHGELGTGGSVGPDLQKSLVADDADQVEEIVRTGRSPMPSFEGQLSDSEIEAVASYVSESLAPRG